LSKDDTDSTASDDDNDDDDNGVDSSTGNCIASTSQDVYLPDTRLQFSKCRDVNADRPAKVSCSVLSVLWCQIFCDECCLQQNRIVLSSFIMPNVLKNKIRGLKNCSVYSL